CVDLDRTTGVNDELGMLVLDRQDRAGVAEVVVEGNVGRWSRLDQQAVTVHALAWARLRREMHQMLRLQHGLAVGIRRAVADIVDHGSSRERARTHLTPFSTRLKYRRPIPSE